MDCPPSSAGLCLPRMRRRQASLLTCLSEQMQTPNHFDAPRRAKEALPSASSLTHHGTEPTNSTECRKSLPKATVLNLVPRQMAKATWEPGESFNARIPLCPCRHVRSPPPGFCRHSRSPPGAAGTPSGPPWTPERCVFDWKDLSQQTKSITT